MQYKIEGGNMPVVTCSLGRGEVMVTQRGGMSWMSDGLEMNTDTGGGLMKGLGRMMTGESMFINKYTALRDNVYIAFASSFPGEIIAYDIGANGPVIAQKRAFLASETGVDINIAFRKKGGFFGGEGFIMQKLSGQGIVFLEIDGAVIKFDLRPGEVIKVDTGHVAMHTESVRYEVEMIKGAVNMLFGGEGMFNTVLTGPGTVWLQTMPAANIAASIMPFIGKKD
jgi:uncharacterized protein (TIGR00266 family)